MLNKTLSGFGVGVFFIVDDGIRYKSDNKKDGYELFDVKKYTGIGIKPQKLGVKPKSNTPQPNYSNVIATVRLTLIEISIF
ncbi:hypothetical protein OAE09_04625 [Alphaproteobacteria bacterium]|nr:hypothetical protein [Alphaproteobacteria bacterium]